MKAWAKRHFILCTNTDLTLFSALLRSLFKRLGNEHTWNHSFHTGRQMERNSSLLPLFCLQGIFGISFRKWGYDPEPSSVSRLSFPTVSPAQRWHTVQEGEVYLHSPTASVTGSMELKSHSERERPLERKWKSNLWEKWGSICSTTLPQPLLADPTELQRSHSWATILCFINFLDVSNRLRIELMNYIGDTRELFHFSTLGSHGKTRNHLVFLLFVLHWLLEENCFCRDYFSVIPAIQNVLTRKL